MNKRKIILIIVVILLMILSSVLSIVIYKQYYENNICNEEKVPLQNLNIFVDTINPIVRIGVSGSNGKHYEITDKENIKKIVNNLNGLKLKLDENAERNRLPSYRYYITIYTYWDKIVWESGVVTENYMRYNDYYYNITQGTFDLTSFEEILNKI